jgi:uroporphyrinogen-III synthase
LDLAADEPVRALAGTRVGAIGATTRAALEAAGVTVDVVAPTPDVAALVSSLADLPDLE